MKFKTFHSVATAALAAGAILCAFPTAAQTNEKVPAFPGAEGFGRYTTGGRGGKVYHVTNLKDSGTGSLRWALSQTGPRTIVFDVSGTIHLTKALTIPGNTTIAGQTAPGDGICIADWPVTLSSNNIIRYVRFRLGSKNSDKHEGDGLGAMDSENIIVDHCSISWSIDECCSVYGSYNTTVQWSIVSQSLVNSGHSKGSHGYGGNWGGSGASYHHNLLAHHGSRTPRLGPRTGTQLDERMDMRNNVIYNYGGNGCYGGEAMNVNIVNNYYKPGPATPTDRKGRRIAGIGIRTADYCFNASGTAANIKNATGNTVSSSDIKIAYDGVVYLTINGTRYDVDPLTDKFSYDGHSVEVAWNSWHPAMHRWGTFFVEGNVNPKYTDVTRDNWNYGIYNQIDTKGNDGTWNDQVKKDIRLSTPIDFVYTTTHTAEEAYNLVLDYAGASLSRDSHDALMVSDTRNGTGTYTGSGCSKGLINTQDDNKPDNAPDDWSAWPTLESTTAPVDTDGDGIPDEWEIENGLDPKNAADGNSYNDEGYTMLEVYLASLVKHITEAQNAGGTAEGDIQEYEPVEDAYIIDTTTREGNTWNFGHGISVSTSSGGYTTSGDMIGYGRNMQHNITLPGGAVIRWVKFEGRGRYSTSSYTAAHLVELNGTEYPEGTYSLRKPADSNDTDNNAFDVALDEKGAINNLTMTWKGNNPLMRVTLHTTEFSGVNDVAVDIDDYYDEGWYNLQGIRFDTPSSPGLYIHKGRKVIVR